MVRLNNFCLLIRFIAKVRAVNRENGRYHKLVKRIAAQEISNAHDINDGSIGRLHFLKIQWYMATNLYLGELIVGLRTQKLTPNEIKSLIYLGALMAITDMMVDDFKMKAGNISQLLQGDFNSQGEKSAIERVFIMFHDELMASIDKEKAKYIREFSLRKPQLESKSQFDMVFTEPDIHEITRKKGGTAVLLTASLLIDITEKNRDQFYQLGAFIQYMNDSQDFMKDIKNGITTFISFCRSFDEVNQKLTEEFDLTTALFLKSEYSLTKVYELLFNLQALYVGIQFKNKVFAKRLGNVIDLNVIPKLESAAYQVSMYSLKSFRYCLPRILKFSY